MAWAVAGMALEVYWGAAVTVVAARVEGDPEAAA